MKYNTNIQNRKKDYDENNSMIRKNYSQMSSKELKFIFDKINKLNFKNTDITKHAENKNLLSLDYIRKILKQGNFDIIDFNYIIDTKEQRVMLRLKKTFLITGIDGKEEKCYIKLVLSLTDNRVVTIWGNKVKDEERKQRNLSTRYANINILTLK